MLCVPVSAPVPSRPVHFRPGLQRLFRLYAHVYCSHNDRIRSIGASAHLNTTFKHLIYFINEFDLVTKTEMAPLEKLISKFTHGQVEPGAPASGSQ